MCCSVTKYPLSLRQKQSSIDNIKSICLKSTYKLTVPERTNYASVPHEYSNLTGILLYIGYHKDSKYFLFTSRNNYMGITTGIFVTVSYNKALTHLWRGTFWSAHRNNMNCSHMLIEHIDIMCIDIIALIMNSTEKYIRCLKSRKIMHHHTQNSNYAFKTHRLYQWQFMFVSMLKYLRINLNKRLYSTEITFSKYMYHFQSLAPDLI